MELGVEDKCVKCGLGNVWQGNPITLELDHINGNPCDDRKINLRILCPNCHSQTDTFRSRNRGNRVIPVVGVIEASLTAPSPRVIVD